MMMYTSYLVAVVVLVAAVPKTLAQDVGESSSSIPPEFVEVLRQSQLCMDRYTNFTIIEDGGVPYEGLFCPPYFDIIICWPPTKAGETSYQPCPEDIDLYQTSIAFRECTINGTWSHAISEEEMYTSGKYCKCRHCEIIFTIMAVGCGISALACIVAFLIFMFTRRLWCRRNHIHWHLITSFIINYFVYFLGYFVSRGLNSADSSAAESQIQVFQRILDTLYYYAMMTNYFWMLVEGLYLHTLVVMAFRVDANRISFLIYIFIGWVLPAIFVSIWALVSHFTSGNGEFAKSLSENGSIQDYICIICPIGVALLINSIFLFNIMRVLCKKLRETMRGEEQQSWRGAKATMVLVVLLGVHYVVFLIIFPIMESQLPISATIVLQYTNTLLTSTQGVQVSVIYVFLNSEVKGSFRRTARKIMVKHDCPCVRPKSGRKRVSSYSRWCTDDNTCISSLRCSPSRKGTDSRISSDFATSQNGGIRGGSSESSGKLAGARQTSLRNQIIEEKSEENEKYEMETLNVNSDKVDANMNADDITDARSNGTKDTPPPPEGVPLLNKRNLGQETPDNEIDISSKGCGEIPLSDVNGKCAISDDISKSAEIRLHSDKIVC